MLLQFFVFIEEGSSSLIIVWLVLKRFQDIVQVRYRKKKCIKLINIKRPSVGGKDYLLLFVLAF